MWMEVCDMLIVISQLRMYNIKYDTDFNITFYAPLVITQTFQCVLWLDILVFIKP